VKIFKNDVDKRRDVCYNVDADAMKVQKLLTNIYIEGKNEAIQRGL
jgi:hypothetical protein